MTIEKILVRAPDTLKSYLQKVAQERGATLNQLLLQILWDWVKGQEKDRG